MDRALLSQVRLDPYGTPTDAWSFGCLLACLQREVGVPFERSVQIGDLASGEVRPSLPADHALAGLVDACCQPAAADRCAMDAALAWLRPGGAAATTLVEDNAARTQCEC